MFDNIQSVLFFKFFILIHRHNTGSLYVITLSVLTVITLNGVTVITLNGFTVITLIGFTVITLNVLRIITVITKITFFKL